jgi:1-acyl-sn-glycerol-3-phosphate acyltransferase
VTPSRLGSAPHAPGKLQRLLLRPRATERVQALHLHDVGHGYDVFGANREAIGWAATLASVLHRYYFRVKSHDPQHIPHSGAAILVANHSGMLPLDAAMLWMDVLEHSDPPRCLRPVVDHFVPALPLIGTWLARAGVANGAAGNVRELLERGELVSIFPEGMAAIGKPASERYRISSWRVGHAELALRHGVPILPVAIIGAEEQWRELARLRAFHPFSAPYLPIPWLPLPLPVRYHIHYGEPIVLGPACAQPTPGDVERAAAQSRAAVERLIEHGLRVRTGLFR